MPEGVKKIGKCMAVAKSCLAAHLSSPSRPVCLTADCRSPVPPFTPLTRVKKIFAFPSSFGIVSETFMLTGSVCQFGVRHKFVCSGESTVAAGEVLLASSPAGVRVTTVSAGVGQGKQGGGRS